MPISAGIAVASLAYGAYKGYEQNRAAKKLKQSDFDFNAKGLQANRDLDLQQAYSRTSPGQELANQQIRRAQANTIAAGQRMYGGDTNKMAAIAASAQGKANDGIAQNAVRGLQFSENAFGRLRGDNQALASQERQNYDNYRNAKSKLLYASDQNIGNAISNASVLGQSYLGSKTPGVAQAGADVKKAGMINPNQNYNPLGPFPFKRNPWFGADQGDFYNQQVNYSGYSNGLS